MKIKYYGLYKIFRSRMCENKNTEDAEHYMELCTVKFIIFYGNLHNI